MADGKAAATITLRKAGAAGTMVAEAGGSSTMGNCACWCWP